MTARPAVERGVQVPGEMPDRDDEDTAERIKKAGASMIQR